MKTKSLVSQKSSSKPSSTADAEIFNLHRLLLPQKPLTKTRSLGPKNHPKSLVLRLTLTSTTHIDYSWQKRGHETESLLSQNSSLKRNSMADADIFNVHRLLLAQKPLMKTRTLGPQKSSKKPVLRLTLTSFAQIKYSWQTNRWWKLSPCCSKNHPRNLVLRLTLKSSIYTDYCYLRNRWWKLGPWCETLEIYNLNM
jgi:hypothetical protein